MPRPFTSIILLFHLSLVLTFAEVAALTQSQQGSHSRPPIFRAPSAKELADAEAAGAPITWSAHQSEDTIAVFSNASQRISLACLLDAGGSASSDHQELSWSVGSKVNGQMTRHTLNGATAERQTFSLDIGQGLTPAIGDFRSGFGSLLVLTFPVAAPHPLAISCDIRLIGSVGIRSARFRLWDERPLTDALTASTASELPCRRTRITQPEVNFTAVTLDCDGPLTAVPNIGLVLGTAIYCLHVSAPSRSCTDPATFAAAPRLQTNMTDPSSFYAFYTRGRLRVGWALEGRGATLQSMMDSAGGSTLCVTADVAVPSGMHRLTMVWRVRLTSSSNVEWNSSSAIGASYSALVMSTNVGGEVTLNRFEEPPIPRVLPCPYLCPTTEVPPCNFGWLHAPSGAATATLGPLDVSLGLLVRQHPHSLLLLPWKSPGNPGPPPLDGVWTCRRVGSLPATRSPEFRVKVIPQPSLCGRQMPSRSVIFLDGEAYWSARQSLTVNCTVCGIDSTVETDLTLLATVGDVEVTTERSSTRLAGGGVELSLRFTAFGKGAGSAILRCRAIDRLGRGSVAYSTVEALQLPSNRITLTADCDYTAGDIIHECRRFRCPLDPILAAAIRDLSLLLSVSFLFTLQPEGPAPPQQVLVGVDYLVLADLQFSRMSCTQLVYYANDEAGTSASNRGGQTSRSQQFFASNAASAAAHRAALGDGRYSRLLLAVESGWLTIEHAVRPAAPNEGLRQAKYQPNNYKPPAVKKKEADSGIDPVDAVVGTLLGISVSVAIFFIVVHFREKLKQLCCRCCIKPTEPGAVPPAPQDPTTGTTASPASIEEEDTSKKKKKKKKKSGDEDSSDESKRKKPKKPRKKKKKGKDSDDTLDAASQNIYDPSPTTGDDEFRPKVLYNVINADVESAHVNWGRAMCVDQLSPLRTDVSEELSISASNNVDIADQPIVRLGQAISLALLSSTSTADIPGAAILSSVTLPRESPLAVVPFAMSPSSQTSSATASSLSPETLMECVRQMSSPVKRPEHIDLQAARAHLPNLLAADAPESYYRLPSPNAVEILLTDQVQIEMVCESRAEELARMRHCLNCRPPRYRVATAVAGIELSVVSPSPPSTVTSPKVAPTVLDVIGQSAEELDLPSSEDSHVISIPGSELILSSEDQQFAAVDGPEVEDLGITGSGCCSEESPVEKRVDDLARSLTTYEEEDEVAKFDRMVREAVRTAVEKSLTFD